MLEDTDGRTRISKELFICHSAGKDEKFIDRISVLYVVVRMI